MSFSVLLIAVRCQIDNAVPARVLAVPTTLVPISPSPRPGTAFDVVAFPPYGSFFSTSFDGYYVELNVSGATSAITQYLGNAAVSLVTLSMKLVQLSDNALLLLFNLQNNNFFTAQRATIGADINVTSLGAVNTVQAFESGKGFSWYDDFYSFSIVGRDYPLVTGVSTYWYGPSSDRRTHRYLQIPQNYVYSEGDAGAAFSWQNVNVPASGAVTLSAILRSGPFDADSPILYVSAVRSDNPASTTDDVVVCYQVDDPAHPDAQQHILAFEDGNAWGLFLGENWFPPGTSGCVTVNQTRRVRLHTFSTYAANEVGCVSTVRNVTRYFTDAQPLPTRIGYKWETGTGKTFNLLWLNETASILIGGGFQVTVEVAGSPSVVDGENPLHISSLVVTPKLVRLSDSTVLFALKLDNPDWSRLVVSVAVDWDTTSVLQGNSTVYGSDDIGITQFVDNYWMHCIGRNSALVRDISTFWYGDYNGRRNHTWEQATTSSVNATRLGVAFSWNSIAVPDYGQVTPSVIFQVNQHKAAVPQLAIADSALFAVETAAVTFTVATDSPSGRLFMYIDDDLIGIRDVGAFSAGLMKTINANISGIAVGAHVLSFCAVDSAGSVSPVVPRAIEIVEVITQTPTPTPGGGGSGDGCVPRGLSSRAKGAIAGGTIGGFVLGALVMFVVLWFLSTHKGLGAGSGGGGGGGGPRGGGWNRGMIEPASPETAGGEGGLDPSYTTSGGGPE